MAPAMPCKTCKKNKHGETRSKINDFKSKFACILEASESTRMRMEESLPKYHEDHIAGKGDNSLQHYNLVHKFIPMLQAMKIQAPKAAVDEECEKLEKIPAWDKTRVRKKSEVIDEAMTKGAKIHFASLMDICHLKIAELEAKHQKYKRSSCTSRRHCARWFWIWCSIHRAKIISIANDGTTAKVMDIISRLLGCAGQAADAVSTYTQIKMEDAPKFLNIPKSECPDIWIRLPRHKWPKSWSSMEDPVVPLERNLYGHPLAGQLWERQFGKILLEHGVKKVPNWECLFVHRPKGLFLSVYVDDIKIGWKETKSWSDVEITQQRSWFGRTNIIPWQCVPGRYSKTMWNKQRCCGQLQSHVWISNVSGGNRKASILWESSYFSWSYDLEGHAKKCVEWYCELANKTTQQLYKVATPCVDDHHFKEEEMESVGELSNTCSQIVLKCLYLARGRPDILWSVNKLARSITKWTKACDKRPALLISYIQVRSEYKNYCLVGNTAKQCRLGLFQDSDSAGDLEDSKSTSGGTLCVFGSHTFVPKSWMCKKQTSVSHSSTESEIISLDAGFKDGRYTCAWLVGSDCYCSSRKYESEQTSTGRLVYISNAKENSWTDWWSESCWFFSSNANSSHKEAMLYIFEDNEAVIKMIIKGRSPTMRHVSRTHRVALELVIRSN